MKCTNCGRELQHGAKFCTNCATKVHRGAWGDKAFGDEASSNRLFIITVSALATVAVVAIIVVVASLLNMGATPSDVALSGGGVSDAATDTLVSHYDENSGSTLLDEKADDEISEAPVVMMPGERRNGDSGDNGGGSGDVDDEALHDLLKAYYEAAGELDGYVRQAADDFNDNYLSRSKETRSELAESAGYLEMDIDELWKSLESLEVPESSQYYETWKDICTLYECLWHRIDVITQAWGISLSYDNPKNHEEEILAPIKADNENGDNIYYTRFNELYPTIKL